MPSSDDRPGAIRILHVSPCYAPAWSAGGLTESVYQSTRELARQGAWVRVLTTDADGADRRLEKQAMRDFERADGLEVRYCGRIARQSVSPALAAALPQLVRWADVIHLHSAYSFPVIPTIVAARVFDKPLVWAPHGALQRWRGSRRTRLKSIWESICLAIAPRRLVLHVTSEEEARESAGRLGAVATAVIANGVTIPANLRRVPPSGTLRLLFIGRLDPKKGVDNLLAACRRLGDRGRVNYSLTVAGSGSPAYEQELRQRACELALGPRLAMAGDVRGESKLRVFENADIVIVPSHTENFAIVVAEALAHGVPVIASTGTPWRDVEKVGCGLWVANDPASIADAIERMSAMPLGEMSAKGRQWMTDRYSWERSARELLRCYAGLLAPAASVPIAVAESPTRSAQ
ncbi:MAG TPA: glycosyltransferase [Candidatus Binataceae bacterium]|nr:glycosyltransferase [Candidatus Binataceae bacterium]